MRRAVFLFAMQFVAVLLVSANIRALAQARVMETAVTDVGYFLMQFLVIRSVAEAKGKKELVGYVAGGVAGSVAAIYATQYLFGS